MTPAPLDHAMAPPSTPAAGKTMTAIVQDEYGPAPEDVLRVEEIDTPAIRAHKVFVRVHAASVDRGAWHVIGRPAYPIRLPGFRPPQAEVSQPRQEPRRNRRGSRYERDRLRGGRRRVRHRRCLVRRAPPGPNRQARAQAAEPVLRARGCRPHLRARRPPRRSRSWSSPGRAEGADRRRIRRRRHIRRADR
jgi:hypothetical protein